MCIIVVEGEDQRHNHVMAILESQHLGQMLYDGGAKKALATPD